MSKEEEIKKKYKENELWSVLIPQENYKGEIKPTPEWVHPFERYPEFDNKYGWQLIEEYESHLMGIKKIEELEEKTKEVVKEALTPKTGRPSKYTNPKVQDLMRKVRGHQITYEYFQKIVPSKDSEGYNEIELSYELKKYKNRKWRDLDIFKTQHNDKNYIDKLQEKDTIIKYLLELIEIRKEERIEGRGNHKPELNRKKGIITNEILNLKQKWLGADKKEKNEIEKKIQTFQKYRKQM